MIYRGRFFVVLLKSLYTRENGLDGVGRYGPAVKVSGNDWDAQKPDSTHTGALLSWWTSLCVTTGSNGVGGPKLGGLGCI